MVFDHKAYMREYNRKNKERLSKWHKEDYAKNKGKIKKRCLDYYQANREKMLEKQIANKQKKYLNDPAFRKKDNIRKYSAHTISLKDKSCEICKTKKDLHRHHEVYDKHSKVRILCRRCHNQLHKPFERDKNLF